jgi:sulfite reductase (ferredoxin)
MLTAEGVNCNTQIGIINDFEEKLVKTGKIFLTSGSFSTQLLRMSEQEPTKEFAAQYLEEAKEFVSKIKEYRNQQVAVK